MKAFAIALGALSIAIVAQASDGSAHERPDAYPSHNVAVAVQTVEVPAGRVLDSKELQRAHLAASDRVTVTLAGHGSTSQDDQRSSRNDQ